MSTLHETKNQKMICTPRGIFRLVEGEEVAKLKEKGFGYHHEHRGYAIVCSHNQGVAVSQEDYQHYFKLL